MNKRTRLISEIADVILAEGLLNEIGEGTYTYPLKSEKISLDAYVAEFDVTDDVSRVLDTIKVRAHVMDVTLYNAGIPFDIKVLSIQFISRMPLTSKRETYYHKTGTNQPLKIISTVVKCIRNFLNSPACGQIHAIEFSGSGSSSKEIKQKEKLYAAYLQKNLHSIKGRTFVNPTPSFYSITNNSFSYLHITAIDKEIQTEFLSLSDNRMEVDELVIFIEHMVELLKELVKRLKNFYSPGYYPGPVRNQIVKIISRFNNTPGIVNRFTRDEPDFIYIKDWINPDNMINIQVVLKWITHQYVDLENALPIFFKGHSSEKPSTEVLHDRPTMITLSRSLARIMSGIETLDDMISRAAKSPFRK